MLAVAGVLAGLAMGYVLQRGDLCFHAAWRGLLEHRSDLARAWIIGVAVTAGGLTVLHAWGPWTQLNRGLAFRPVDNVVGGLLLGVGMVVASSCASGLFYKLGSGMLGAAAGLGGWALGEVAASRVDLPGPTLLHDGAGATLPAVLGIPHWVGVAVVMALAAGMLARVPAGISSASWAWPRAGVALGLATVVGWAMAGVAGHTFGPSTVGAVAGFADGHPQWWSTFFLGALVPGATAAARRSGTWWVRAERPLRYAQIVLGGVLLGAGGVIGGGGNLGHGLSGAAQLNVSSWVVIGSALVGIRISTRVWRVRAGQGSPRRWTPQFIADTAPAEVGEPADSPVAVMRHRRNGIRRVAIHDPGEVS